MNALRQVGVVTGASSGIGQAIALALSRLGMDLALVGRDSTRLDAVAAQASLSSVRAKAYCADLNRDEDICRFVSSVGRDFGSVDVIVHCAAMFRMGSI